MNYDTATSIVVGVGIDFQVEDWRCLEIGRHWRNEAHIDVEYLYES